MIIFSKFTTCISGPNDDIITPRSSTKLDYEVELGIVIGKECVNVGVVLHAPERGFLKSKVSLRYGRLRQIFAKIPNSRVDYIAVVDPQTLEPMKRINRPALLVAALRIGKTRLIDNILIA